MFVTRRSSILSFLLYVVLRARINQIKVIGHEKLIFCCIVRMSTQYYTRTVPKQCTESNVECELELQEKLLKTGVHTTRCRKNHSNLLCP